MRSGTLTGRGGTGCTRPAGRSRRSSSASWHRLRHICPAERDSDADRAGSRWDAGRFRDIAQAERAGAGGLGLLCASTGPLVDPPRRAGGVRWPRPGADSGTRAIYLVGACLGPVRALLCTVLRALHLPFEHHAVRVHASVRALTRASTKDRKHRPARRRICLRCTGAGARRPHSQFALISAAAAQGPAPAAAGRPRGPRSAAAAMAALFAPRRCLVKHLVAAPPPPAAGRASPAARASLSACAPVGPPLLKAPRRLRSGRRLPARPTEPPPAAAGILTLPLPRSVRCRLLAPVGPPGREPPLGRPSRRTRSDRTRCGSSGWASRTPLTHGFWIA